MATFIKLYLRPDNDSPVKQSVNIEEIAHFNNTDKGTEFEEIYIYFKNDPSGMHGKAIGFIHRDDLYKIWN